MKPSKNSTDILNLSQSLEDNQTKIEETHKLIQQIEKQLQTLSQQPSIPLSIPTETHIQNQSQYQNDLFQMQPKTEQQDQNLARDNPSQYYFTGQQERFATEYGQQNQNQLYNQGGQIQIDQQDGYQLESKQQSAQFQQFSNNNSLPNSQLREVGKIRNQNPPSRGEKNLITSGGVNQSFLKDSGKDREVTDTKELQREHFQEITLLEQAYRKKILEMEEIIEQQKLQYEKQVIEMQHMLQVIEQKESIIGSFKNRQTEQFHQQRILSQQDQLSEIMIYAKKLESSEKEKQELMNQNQDLIRQYKLVLSQNEILSNKYNRILSLYNQLVDNDKEKFIQMQYAEVINKENSLFLSPLIQQPNSAYQNQINISSIQPNPLVNSTPGQNHLQDSHIQLQNQLDLLDEIYQQRSAAVFNSFNRKSQPQNLSNQKNPNQYQLKKQLFPVEQMYNNIQNQQQNNQSYNYASQAVNLPKQYQNNNITQQFTNKFNQNEMENQQIKIQNRSVRNQSSHSSDSEGNALPSKDIENQNLTNQKSKKQLLSPLRENQNINKIKSPNSKTKKIGGDLQQNVAKIKNILDENIKTNDNQSEIQRKIQAPKTTGTLQNILDISDSASNKKLSKSKSTIGSKLVLNSKQNQGSKGNLLSKSNLKVKSSKRSQK